MKTKTGVCRPCCAGCKIKGDDFNRANDTDIGSVLAEISGDATILDNRLAMPTNGIVEATGGPAASDTDGHKAEWTIAFGNIIGVTRYIRVHVDVVDDDNSHYAEIKPVVPSVEPIHFTMEIFKLTGGVPESIAGPIENQDIATGVAEDQSICVSIDGNKIVAVVNSVELETEDAITPHGGTKTRLQTINTSNLKADDFIFSKISADPDPDCPHCTGLPPSVECEVCENADEEFLHLAPKKIKLVIPTGLANLFADSSQWGGTPFQSPPTEFAWQYPNRSGSDSIDDNTWDVDSIAGTYILPFLSCDYVTADDHGELIYGLPGVNPVNRFILPGVTHSNGQHWMVYNGAVTVEPLISEPSIFADWWTTEINVTTKVHLIKLASGAGFKLRATVYIWSNKQYGINSYDGTTFYPWNTQPWIFSGGSGGGLIDASAVFESDTWDGECLELPDMVLDKVSSGSDTGFIDWSGVSSVTIGLVA